MKWTYVAIDDEELFIMNELKEAIQELKLKKVPDSDGIFAESLRVAMNVYQEMMLNVMNGCLRNQSLLESWKRARVVLIPNGMSEGEIVKYISVCMISVFRKFLEHLIRKRVGRVGVKGRYIAEPIYVQKR